MADVLPTYHTEMNRHSWVRDGKFVQSFQKLIPLTLLKEIKGLSDQIKAEPSVRDLQGGLGSKLGFLMTEGLGGTGPRMETGLIFKEG